MNNNATGLRIPGFSRDDIRQLKAMIPLPPLHEQQAIAKALSDVDELIEGLDKLIAKKRDIKQATMQQLLTGRRRLPEFFGDCFKPTKLGAVPEDWEVLSINDLVSKCFIEKPVDGNHGNIHPKSSDFVETGIPFVMANNVYNGCLDLTSCNFLKKEQADRLQKGFSFTGDVLLTHKGTVGHVAIVDKLSTEYIMLTPQVTYYRVKTPSAICNTWIKQYFLSHIFQEMISNISGGGTRAYIGITSQGKLLFILPPIKEQTAIAQVLSDMDEEIEVLEARRDKTKALKQGMMQELLTGRIRLV